MSTNRKAIVLVGTLVLLGAAGAAMPFLPGGPAPRAASPVKFNHAAHAGRGLECAHCHAGTAAESRAGIPAIGILASPEEPAGERWFSHKKHVGDESLECASCHTKAAKGDEAGMPTGLKKCMSCHETLDESRPAGRKLADLVGEKPAWVRATSIPAEVKFSHKAHVDKEIACATCHVGVEKSEAVSTSLRVSMATCMACHEQKKAPADCRSCHESIDPRAPLTCMHCHAVPRGKDPEEAKLRDLAARGTSAPWHPAARMPGHVYFSHAHHVNPGGGKPPMQCADCHGDVKGLREPAADSPVTSLSMGKCMECHRDRKAELECAGCHK